MNVYCDTKQRIAAVEGASARAHRRSRMRMRERSVRRPRGRTAPEETTGNGTSEARAALVSLNYISPLWRSRIISKQKAS